MASHTTLVDSGRNGAKVYRPQRMELLARCSRLRISIHPYIPTECLRSSASIPQAIIGILRESILVLDIKFRVVTANNSFYKTFKVTARRKQLGRLFMISETANGTFCNSGNYCEMYSHETRSFGILRWTICFRRSAAGKCCSFSSLKRDPGAQRSRRPFLLSNVERVCPALKLQPGRASPRNHSCVHFILAE